MSNCKDSVVGRLPEQSMQQVKQILRTKKAANVAHCVLRSVTAGPMVFLRRLLLVRGSRGNLRRLFLVRGKSTGAAIAVWG